MTRWRRGLCLALATVLGCGAGPALAYRLDVPAVSAIGLGTIVADSSVLVFSVNAASGMVTRISGTAIRLTSGTVTTPTVTITCATGGGGGNCKRTFVVQILAGSTVSGRPTTITSLNVSNLSGAGVTFSPSSPTPGVPLTFDIVSSVNKFTVTFQVGLNASFNASATTGNTDWTYVVSVS